MTGEKKNKKILAKSLKVPQFFFGVKMAIVFFGMRKLSFHVWKPSGEKKFGFNECFELINTLVPNKLFSPLSHFSSQFHTWKKKIFRMFFPLGLTHANLYFPTEIFNWLHTHKIKFNHEKKKNPHYFCFFQEEIFVLKKHFSLGLKEIFFPPLPNQILNKKMFTLHKSLVHDRIHIQGKTTIHAYNHTYRQSRVTD